MTTDYCSIRIGTGAKVHAAYGKSTLALCGAGKTRPYTSRSRRPYRASYTNDPVTCKTCLHIMKLEGK